MMTTNELLFDRKIELQSGERKLCLECAREAMSRLRRSRCLDWMFSPIRSYDLMWCLSSYALFLREVAAGRKIRYRKLTEIAVAGAAVMGNGEILKVLKRSGVDIPLVRWSRGKLAPFKAWALRGMNTYGQNCEGNYAIDGATMPKWRSLVSVFGMSPMHRAYDGSSALGCAIASHNDETAKWLWLHGDHAEWSGDSPLRLCILNCNDDLAKWFKAQGVKNVDSDGCEYPIPSWV